MRNVIFVSELIGLVPARKDVSHPKEFTFRIASFIFHIAFRVLCNHPHGERRSNLILAHAKSVDCLALEVPAQFFGGGSVAAQPLIHVELTHICYGPGLGHDSTKSIRRTTP